MNFREWMNDKRILIFIFSLKYTKIEHQESYILNESSS